MSFRAVSCAALLLALCTVAAAQDAGRARADAQSRRVSDRIRALQAEADRLAGQARTLLDDLRALEVGQQLAAERVQDADAEVARGEAAVLEAARRIESLEQQRVAQIPDLQAQLVDIYKRGRTGYVRLLLGGSTMRDFSRATRAVAALMRINEQRVAEHRRTLEELRSQRAGLEEELRQLEAGAGEARQARVAAERAVAARAARITEIDQRRDLNAQLAGELQVAYDRLQQQMANATPTAVAVPLAPFRGALAWPVAGRVTARFGQPSGRGGDATRRNGIEIAAPEGAPVEAVHPGTVSYAEPFTGFGNLVIVDHGDNTFSLYGYLSSMSVSRGAAVDGGTELGRVGLAPAGPAALYFEVRVDGRSVDPVQWLEPR